jgi:RimJ/RimL family protein N-acetyltransferase/nitroimidazol reductase NimA-like FMN-containing flavoprotein (pyridoxamine 5'-phosphate oxidase superfamily)
MSDTFPRTPRTSASRDRGRVTYDRAAANAILDEAYLCHLGFTVDNEPRVLPTLHVRLDDTLYIHGSTGSRPLLAARAAAPAGSSAKATAPAGSAAKVTAEPAHACIPSADGLAVCVTVTHLDGIVLARSQFNHSANYRCVVAHGRAHLVTDETEKLRVLTALVDKIAVGRAADSRPPTRKELAETAVLALPLTEVSVKTRAGGVIDEPADLDLPHWAGVLPLRVAAGIAEPAPDVTAPLPSYLHSDRGPWLTTLPMRGDHVILEPLDMSHVRGLFTTIVDEEVFRWLPQACPTTVDEVAALVREALAMYQRGSRLPFVQRSAQTGAVVGTTSYYAPDPVNRSIAIGHTMLGRAWWRTGVNTEAKLLLMRHAFDHLGAVRVEWHTDLRNVRSQRAIARLGTVREGVHRRHRLRADGTWRDTVTFSMTDEEWPTAQRRLEQMLRAPAG